MKQAAPNVYHLGEVFTPSSPVDKKDLFAGRRKEVERVINAIIMSGQHVALYGERGVGKTSLATVIHEFLPQGQGVVNVKVNCDGDTTFKNLFSSILEEIKLVTTQPGMGFHATDTEHIESLRKYVEEDDINPNNLRFLFRQLRNKVIVIIDEFDRVEDEDAKRLLADTIKNFSDYKVDTTLVLVGIADSVDDLIKEHQSVERALVQVSMPRMTKTELEEIINKGLTQLGLQIDSTAKNKIVKLSQGLPHYTHLLSYHAAQIAMRKEANKIVDENITEAISQSVEMGQQSIEERYFKAINSPRGNMYPQVLLSCALADRDDMGYFAATGVRNELSRIMKKNYQTAAFSQHLQQFCSDSRGPVLKRVGYPRRYKYRFINPLLEPHVIIKGLAEELIADDDLK